MALLNKNTSKQTKTNNNQQRQQSTTSNQNRHNQTRTPPVDLASPRSKKFFFNSLAAADLEDTGSPCKKAKNVQIMRPAMNQVGSSSQQDRWIRYRSIIRMRDLFFGQLLRSSWQWNPDIESLVDSEVLSQDWPIKAKPNKKTNHHTNQKHKQHKTDRANPGKLMVKRETKPRLSCYLRQHKVAFDTLDMV